MESEKFFFTPSLSIETAVVEITPTIARKLLDMTDTTKQRKINAANAKMLQNQMEQKKWCLNGDAIRQDIHGNILDGQHRLTACVASKVNFQTLFVKGVPWESMHTIDRGKTRSLADVLDIRTRGTVKYSNSVAAIVRFVWNFDAQKYATATSGGSRRTNMDSTDFMAWIDANPSVYLFVEDAMKSYNNGDRLISPKLFCGLKWIFSRIDEKKSESFFQELSEGIGIKKENPVSLLRRRLLRSKTSADRRDKISEKDQMLLVAKTWDAYSNNKTISMLTVPKKMPQL